MQKENGNENELTIEEAFSRVEELLSSLQDPEIGLDESIRLYTEGISVLKQCREKIDLAEKKVMVLNEKGDWDAF